MGGTGCRKGWWAMPRIERYDRVETLDDWPDDPQPGVLYVRKSADQAPQFASIICPCGWCGFLLSLCCNETGTPRWDLTFDDAGLPSISPSVNRLDHCRAHFFLRHGQIEWCGEPLPEPEGTVTP